MSVHRGVSTVMAVAALAMIPTTISACGDESDEPATIGAADAFTAIIRWELSEHPVAPNDDGSVDLSVIYVSSAHGDSIDATTQASVADATKDEAVVRFTDRREDAVDMDDEAEPVKDGNVMLLVGTLPADSRTIEVDVVRYKSLDNQPSFLLTLTSSVDGARVTSVTRSPS